MDTENRNLDFLKEIMEDEYNLIYVDYRDDLDDNLNILQECLEEKNTSELWMAIDDWYLECRDKATNDIMETLKEKFSEINGMSQEETDSFFKEHEDKIREMIEERDVSSPIRDLLHNTGEIPVRIEMLSNYDCIGSEYIESAGKGYFYEQSYFGDMINALRLNPAKVKKTFIENGYNVTGRFPNLKNRDGKELISYQAFYDEVTCTTCGANLLTFTGLINPYDLYEKNFEITKITIPKGNTCGLFSSFYGGGSLMEAELLHDHTITLETKRNKGYRLVIDDQKVPGGYSIRDVYGVCKSFYEKQIKTK